MSSLSALRSGINKNRGIAVTFDIHAHAPAHVLITTRSRGFFCFFFFNLLTATKNKIEFLAVNRKN